ncbi:MAG TPA: hypothetical protein VGR52_02535 [Stellaceae bacterium]|nr:hypothetical protein [Stellaceae bacterium]
MNKGREIKTTDVVRDRNPYHAVDGTPQLLTSVFAYMDILGFREMIGQAEEKNRQTEFLEALHNALSAGRVELEEPQDGVHSLLKKDLSTLKAFTDNIVIGWPIRDDAESETGAAFSSLGLFQFEMVRRGFFVRGALSIGLAFIDDIAVFGDALTQAYKGETELARDPRIILTESAVNAVKHHLRYYGNGLHAPQVRDLLRDADGQWFLNYLDCVLIAEEEHGPLYAELMEHKETIEKKLAEHKNRPPIFSKYVWAANYHNSFCDLHSRHFSREHKINQKLFNAPPSLILNENGLTG